MLRPRPSTTLRPRKRFGQHFLEPAWIEKVIAAIDPQPDQTFIEIGPGRGALTRPLAARAKAVIAFEIDRHLAAALRESAPPNVTLVEGDFLETADRLGHRQSMSGPLRVAGNLPYNVASPIMFTLVDLARRGVPLVDATVMLQREVAERLAAPPGSRDYGVLSVLIGHRASVRRVLTLPPGAFRPPPKVHSAVVSLRFHTPDPIVANEELFAAIVQAVFTRRRKTLANALLAFEGTQTGTQTVRRVLDIAAIDGRRRPETLAIAEFARLADAFPAAAS